MRRSVLCLLTVALASPVSAGGGPATLSPGDPDRFGQGPRCPTFSWAPAEPGAAHELVVFEVLSELEEPSLRLRTLVAGGASSWAISGEDCLLPGRYAWTLREAIEGSDEVWSVPRLFAVAAGPPHEELRWALETLKRHRDRGGFLDPDLDRALTALHPPSGPVTQRPRAAPITATADAVGLRADRTGAAAGVALHAVSRGEAGSAALVGEATSATGRVDGIRVAGSSDDGTALELIQEGSGRLLVAKSSVADALFVEADGTLVTGTLEGDGSGLTGDPEGLICTACVSGGDVADGAVQTQHLNAESVGSAKLAPGAVGSLQLADGSVGGGTIRNDAVTATHLATNSVVSRAVAVGAVTSAKIQSAGVGTDDLATGAISNDQISGTEIRVYAMHTSCSYPDAATVDSTCESRLCLALPLTFLSCSGDCNRTASVICANSSQGYLLGLDAVE